MKEISGASHMDKIAKVRYGKRSSLDVRVQHSVGLELNRFFGQSQRTDQEQPIQESRNAQEVEIPKPDLLKQIKAFEFYDPDKAKTDGTFYPEFIEHYNEVFGAYLDGRTKTIDLLFPDKEYIKNHKDPEIRERGSKISHIVTGRYNMAIRRADQYASDLTTLRSKSYNDLRHGGLGSMSLAVLIDGHAIRPISQH